MKRMKMKFIGRNIITSDGAPTYTLRFELTGVN